MLRIQKTGRYSSSPTRTDIQIRDLVIRLLLAFFSLIGTSGVLIRFAPERILGKEQYWRDAGVTACATYPGWPGLPSPRTCRGPTDTKFCVRIPLCVDAMRYCSVRCRCGPSWGKTCCTSSAPMAPADDCGSEVRPQRVHRWVFRCKVAGGMCGRSRVAKLLVLVLYCRERRNSQATRLVQVICFSCHPRYNGYCLSALFLDAAIFPKIVSLPYLDLSLQSIRDQSYWSIQSGLLWRCFSAPDSWLAGQLRSQHWTTATTTYILRPNYKLYG